MRHDLGIDPRTVNPLRIDGQTRHEQQPVVLACSTQAFDLWPRRFRVDMVDGDGRDAAPVVDAGVEESREIVVRQVRRRLQMRVRTEKNPGDRNRPQELVEGRVRRARHLRSGLCAKVLNDHLLHVSVALREVPDCKQRIDALGTRLADPDQDSGRERNARVPGGANRPQPFARIFVRRSEVRTTAFRQAIGRRLKHQPHRRADAA